MTRSELPQRIRRQWWTRRALAVAVVVPVLTLGAACGSTTPDAAVTTSSQAPAPASTSAIRHTGSGDTRRRQR